MTEEWEYIEESIAAANRKSYLDSCPAVCRNCRFLDWYYEFGCTQHVYPVNDKCYLFANHKWFKPLFLRQKWDIQYKLWRVKVWFFEKILRIQRNSVVWMHPSFYDNDLDADYDGEDW